MINNLVTTIIPVYNRPEQLREAAASVLAQDHRPIEVIIVDDGSTDGATQGVARALAEANPGVVRHVVQANAGPGAAREHGRQLAQGEFIQYLDSDDLLRPGKFTAQVQGLRSDPQAGISYGLTLERDESTGVSQATHGTDVMHRKIFPAVFAERIWHTITPLYRRAVTDAIGPWSPARILEDWDYDCRAGLLGVQLHYCADVVAIHRFHGGEHAGLAWQHDARSMSDRIQAYAKVMDYARQAELTPTSPEMQRLVRSVFWMAREAGAAGFPTDSQRLFGLARAAAGDKRGGGMDFRLYALAAGVVGWANAGKASVWRDSIRKTHGLQSK